MLGIVFEIANLYFCTSDLENVMLGPDESIGDGLGFGIFLVKFVNGFANLEKTLRVS